MTLDPDTPRIACSLAALYFGSTSLHALDAPGGQVIAPALALIGLWLALIAAADTFAFVRENVSA
jgi:hypothetical protein